jgi:DNA repair protein RadC
LERPPARGRDAGSRSALAHREGPRERLESHGPEALSDAELLALLLRTGGAGRDALSLAEALLRHHRGLQRLAASPANELRAHPGVGPVKSAALVAAQELGRRLAARRLRAGDPVRDPADVYRHFHPRLRDVPHERFVLLLLDGRHRMLREVVVSQGTLTASLVHPREVFRPALREAAAALILVHNHPSGDPTPSAEDLDVTARLVRAGELLGVPVLDHLVVAERGFTSLRQQGAVPSGGASASRSRDPRGAKTPGPWGSGFSP